MSNLKQKVLLVDEHDNPVGESTVLEAHEGKGKRHRAISVFLFNHEGKLLIQQRSEKKIVGALQWGNTCCGNVMPNETLETCAMRRLQEELGITKTKLKEFYTFEYHVQCNEQFSEWEMDHIFVGKFDGNPKLNFDEVLQTRWILLKDLKKEMKDQLRIFSPWLEIILEDGKVGKYASN